MEFKIKSFKIAFCVLIPAFLSLAGCGRKLPPKPAEGSVITYPLSYPRPNDCIYPPPLSSPDSSDPFLPPSNDEDIYPSVPTFSAGGDSPYPPPSNAGKSYSSPPSYHPPTTSPVAR